MNMPLEVCELRDPKGLYKLARAGKIRGVILKPFIHSAIGFYHSVTGVV